MEELEVVLEVIEEEEEEEEEEETLEQDEEEDSEDEDSVYDDEDDEGSSTCESSSSRAASTLDIFEWGKGTTPRGTRRKSFVDRVSEFIASTITEEMVVTFFQSVGRGVAVDGRMITRVDNSFCGVIASDALSAPDFEYNVCIEELDGDVEPNLALGLARVKDCNIPSTLGGDWLFWMMTFDGWQWDGGKKEWSTLELENTQLKEGTIICVKICDDRLHLYVGDELYVGPSKLPNLPLYPAIDLLGVRTVSIYLPSSSNRDKTSETGDAGVEELIQSSSSDKIIKEIKSNEENGIDAGVEVMSIGKGLEIENFAILTRISDRSCGACSSEAIDPVDGFQIKLVDVPFPELGIAVGFSLDPVIEIPELLCGEGMWLMGYNGRHWDGGSGKWGDTAWECGNLCKGDVIGCKVINGTLSLFVNQDLVAFGPKDIPEAMLYPLVDLQGVRQVIFVSNVNDLVSSVDF